MQRILSVIYAHTLLIYSYTTLYSTVVFYIRYILAFLFTDMRLNIVSVTVQNVLHLAENTNILPKIVVFNRST